MRRFVAGSLQQSWPALIIMTAIAPLQAGNAYRHAAARMPHFLRVTSAGLAMGWHWVPTLEKGSKTCSLQLKW